MEEKIVSFWDHFDHLITKGFEGKYLSLKNRGFKILIKNVVVIRDKFEAIESIIFEFVPNSQIDNIECRILMGDFKMTKGSKTSPPLPINKIRISD